MIAKKTPPIIAFLKALLKPPELQLKRTSDGKDKTGCEPSNYRVYRVFSLSDSNHPTA